MSQNCGKYMEAVNERDNSCENTSRKMKIDLKKYGKSNKN